MSEEKVVVQMFKAAESNKRFNANQRVWIKHNFDNYLVIRHRWRGSGRYVTSKINKHNSSGSGPNKYVGTYNYLHILVPRSFAERHGLQIIGG